MFKIIITLIILFSINILSAADPDREWRREVDLRGYWHFSIGDNSQWSKTDFDDSEWEKIFAPSAWEDEGYPGYDGYAWYRKEFEIKQAGDNLYVHLGFIDDVDEVFINGKLIGFSGSLPPNYSTAYNIERVYHIPASFIKPNSKNVIAIRVFDAELSGGPLHGNLGIYTKMNSLGMILSLEGLWKFSLGDNESRKDYNYDDDKWDEILVPMKWEAQGYRDYDGFAWYRVRFRLSPKFRNEDMTLLLGKIDDLDETYLNGKMVGRTGYMRDNPNRMRIEGSEWQEMRDYRLNNDELYFDKDNVIAIRVFDGTIDGGIFEGPIGIVNSKDFRYWKKKSAKNVFFDFLEIFK